jgi:hypothetical protein
MNSGARKAHTRKAHTAGFLPDQPAPAGAQPWSTHPPTTPDQPGLTGASTGTPSQPEEPRPDLASGLQEAADLVAIMTDQLNREEPPANRKPAKPKTPFTQQT